MTQVRAAYIGSGNAGNGVLYYQGSRYPFSVGGLGVAGIGVSKIEAYGEVYGLRRLSDFPGSYLQGRYGFALGNTSTGDLWLQNGNGVVMLFEFYDSLWRYRPSSRAAFRLYSPTSSKKRLRHLWFSFPPTLP